MGHHLKKARHRPPRTSIWILAVTFAFGGIAETSPAMLCIGDDGHADVEYSLAGCCLFEVEEPTEDRTAPTISDRSACDDCVDLGIGQRCLASGKKLLPTPGASVFNIGLIENRGSGAPTPVSTQDVGHDALAAMISSVVLVI
jgi:hypothetical protein